MLSLFKKVRKGISKVFKKVKKAVKKIKIKDVLKVAAAVALAFVAPPLFGNMMTGLGSTMAGSSSAIIASIGNGVSAIGTAIGGTAATAGGPGFLSRTFSSVSGTISAGIDAAKNAGTMVKEFVRNPMEALQQGKTSFKTKLKTQMDRKLQELSSPDQLLKTGKEKLMGSMKEQLQQDIGVSNILPGEHDWYKHRLPPGQKGPLNFPGLPSWEEVQKSQKKPSNWFTRINVQDEARAFGKEAFEKIVQGNVEQAMGGPTGEEQAASLAAAGARAPQVSPFMIKSDPLSLPGTSAGNMASINRDINMENNPNILKSANDRIYGQVASGNIWANDAFSASWQSTMGNFAS